jgi:predicted HTH domain antitoxin
MGELKSEASIEKASRIAGVSVSKMMDMVHERHVEMNLDHEDYLRELDSPRKI